MKRSFTAARWIGLGVFCVSISSGPADPGTTFRKLRAAMVKAFDRNHDGWLDAQEREAMRKTAFARTRRRENRGRGFRMPPEMVRAFDRNRDGDLDGQEMRALFVDMQRRSEALLKKYDANGDGRLDEPERAALGRDIDRGKLESLDRAAGWRLRGFAGGRGRFGRGGGGNSDLGILRFDRDKDGRASKAELEAIQEALKNGQLKRPPGGF